MLTEAFTAIAATERHPNVVGHKSQQPVDILPCDDLLQLPPNRSEFRIASAPLNWRQSRGSRCGKNERRNQH